MVTPWPPKVMKNEAKMYRDELLSDIIATVTKAKEAGVLDLNKRIVCGKVVNKSKVNANHLNKFRQMDQIFANLSVGSISKEKLDDLFSIGRAVSNAIYNLEEKLGRKKLLAEAKKVVAEKHGLGNGDLDNFNYYYAPTSLAATLVNDKGVDVNAPKLAYLLHEMSETLLANKENIGLVLTTKDLIASLVAAKNSPFYSLPDEPAYKLYPKVRERHFDAFIAEGYANEMISELMDKLFIGWTDGHYKKKMSARTYSRYTNLYFLSKISSYLSRFVDYEMNTTPDKISPSILAGIYYKKMNGVLKPISRNHIDLVEKYFNFFDLPFDKKKVIMRHLFGMGKEGVKAEEFYKKGKELLIQAVQNPSEKIRLRPKELIQKFKTKKQ